MGVRWMEVAAAMLPYVPEAYEQTHRSVIQVTLQRVHDTLADTLSAPSDESDPCTVLGPPTTASIASTDTRLGNTQAALLVPQQPPILAPPPVRAGGAALSSRQSLVQVAQGLVLPRMSPTRLKK